MLKCSSGIRCGLSVRSLFVFCYASQLDLFKANGHELFFFFFALLRVYDRPGLHQHTGSGIRDPSKLAKGASVLFKTADLLHKEGLMDHLEFMDIGGGFKVPYEPGEKPIPLADLVR